MLPEGNRGRLVRGELYQWRHRVGQGCVVRKLERHSLETGDAVRSDETAPTCREDCVKNCSHVCLAVCHPPSCYKGLSHEKGKILRTCHGASCHAACRQVSTCAPSLTRPRNGNFSGSLLAHEMQHHRRNSTHGLLSQGSTVPKQGQGQRRGTTLSISLCQL